MGAYLLFRLADASRAEDANEFLKNQPEYEYVKEHQRHFLFFTEAHRAEMVEAHNEEIVDEIYRDVGEEKLKFSGIVADNKDTIKQKWAALFEKLHDRFEIEVYSQSCALGTDEDGEYYYLTDEQADAITDGGEALTGTR